MPRISPEFLKQFIQQPSGSRRMYAFDLIRIQPNVGRVGKDYIKCIVGQIECTQPRPTLLGDYLSRDISPYVELGQHQDTLMDISQT